MRDYRFCKFKIRTLTLMLGRGKCSLDRPDGIRPPGGHFAWTIRVASKPSHSRRCFALLKVNKKSYMLHTWATSADQAACTLQIREQSEASLDESAYLSVVAAIVRLLR